METRRVAGATAVVRRLARSPLKLLTPRCSGDVAHVVTSTYGGGLLPGDQIVLRLVAGAATRTVLGTQASTKVYRGEPGRRARQSIHATIAAGAVLAVAPDPVTCFAGARYEQRQVFDLEASASLLLVDWITAGRAACGERWAMRRYRSDTRIHVGGACVARDALLLDPDDGPIDAPHRAGRFDCLATVFLLGPAFAAAAAGVLDHMRRTRLQRGAALVASASPVAGGCVLRVAGGGAEAVAVFVGSLLAPAWVALGADPWSRKW